MPPSDDYRLTLRGGLALVLANVRYWTTVAPLVSQQLRRWNALAEKIPDPMLRDVALTAHREERFNAQATATLATLAPSQHRAEVVVAIVALQVLYDYLDGLLEQPLADPLKSGQQLYQALVDATAPNTKPPVSYYTETPWSDDGNYLPELVQAIQQAQAQLPALAAVAGVFTRVAQRCSEAQVRAHATAVLGDRQLEQWARKAAECPPFGWREYVAASVSSGLALHALIATAADPCASREQASAIDKAYLPICAVTTLLDGLVDYEQDLQQTGQPGYIRYYQTQDELLHAISQLLAQAKNDIRGVTHSAHHLMTLTGVAAYYSTSPTASHRYSSAVIDRVNRELRPLITPALAVMSAWRIAKRATARIKRLYPQ